MFSVIWGILHREEEIGEVICFMDEAGHNLNQLTMLANMGRLTVLRSNEPAGGYAALCERVSRLTEAG